MLAMSYDNVIELCKQFLSIAFDRRR